MFRVELHCAMSACGWSVPDPTVPQVGAPVAGAPAQERRGRAATSAGAGAVGAVAAGMGLQLAWESAQDFPETSTALTVSISIQNWIDIRH